VQSLAASQFLPYLSVHVDRETMHSRYNQTRRADRVALIANGWFNSKTIQWPPGPALDPVLVSMYFGDELAPKVRRKTAFIDEYVSRYGSIGLRDAATFRRLGGRSRTSPTQAQNFSVSGCATLLLRSPLAPAERHTGDVLIVDVDSASTAAVVPASVLARAKHLKMTVRTGDFSDARLVVAAYVRLLAYARARLVVTTRIHVALPCVAFGTPVVRLSRKWEAGLEGHFAA